MTEILGQLLTWILGESNLLHGKRLLEQTHGVHGRGGRHQSTEVAAVALGGCRPPSRGLETTAAEPGASRTRQPSKGGGGPRPALEHSGCRQRSMWSCTSAGAKLPADVWTGPGVIRVALDAQGFPRWDKQRLGGFCGISCLPPEAINPQEPLQLHGCSGLRGGGAAAFLRAELMRRRESRLP